MTASPEPARAARPAHLLVVDDERQNRQLIEAMLAGEGYELEMATGAEQAFAAVAQRIPDLILLDVMMPGMDGYQVAATFKGGPATRGVPIILLSSLDDSSSRSHGLRAGAEHFLTKPINGAALRACIREQLRGA